VKIVLVTPLLPPQNAATANSLSKLEFLKSFLFFYYSLKIKILGRETF